MNMCRRETKSSFNGRIVEIPGIYVDNFENPETDNAIVYFLSHYHFDHTVGLGSSALHQKLSKNNIFIYATYLCAKIITYNYGHLKEYVKVLKLGSNLITLRGKDDSEIHVNVTLIPAGHCLGSTMFLFETTSTKVLYTGDFRIRENDLPKYASLHCDGKVVKLDSLYVDTTFIGMEYLDFPKRSDTVSDAVRLIRDLLEDDSVCVVLKTSANYGYEHVFNMIYKELRMKVYVDDEKWAFYSTIQHLIPGVTNNSTQTRIYLKNAPITSKYKIKWIKFSAMVWKNWSEDTVSVASDKNMYKICFSTHCSRSELISFVEYMKPVKVIGFPYPYMYGIHGPDITVSKTSPRKTPVKRAEVRCRPPKDRKVDPEVLKKLFG